MEETKVNFLSIATVSISQGDLEIFVLNNSFDNTIYIFELVSCS